VRTVLLLIVQSTHLKLTTRSWKIG